MYVNSSISLWISGHLRRMPVSHAMGTDAPPYPYRHWLFHLSLITAWTVFLLFGKWSQMLVLSQKQLKVGLIWPQNMCPLSFRPSEMSFCPENSFAEYSLAHVAIMITVAWQFLVLCCPGARRSCASDSSFGLCIMRFHQTPWICYQYYAL